MFSIVSFPFLATHCVRNFRRRLHDDHLEKLANEDESLSGIYTSQIENLKWRCDRNIKRQWVERNTVRQDPKTGEICNKLGVLIEATKRNPTALLSEQKIAIKRGRTTVAVSLDPVSPISELKSPSVGVPSSSLSRPKPLVSLLTQDHNSELHPSRIDRFIELEEKEHHSLKLSNPLTAPI